MSANILHFSKQRDRKMSKVMLIPKNLIRIYADILHLFNLDRCLNVK